MNVKKLQAPSSKLQGNPKVQARTAWARLLKFDVWSFSRASLPLFGALFLFSLSACANQPSISLSSLPLFFEPQEAVPGVPSSFLARGQNYQFRITPTGAEIVLSKAETASGDLDDRSPTTDYQLPITSYAKRNTQRATRFLGMQLVGSNPYTQIHADGLLRGKINYLLGNDSAQWRTGLSVYSKVRLDDVYPGINLVYYGNQHQLEYDFIIAPGADPENIALHFDGIDQIEINKDGDLVLSLGGDEICFHLPVLYQQIYGTRQPVTGSYQFKDPQTVVFQVGKYDRDLPLLLYPTLSNFPTTNAAFPTIKGFIDPTFHTYPTDAFVSKLDPITGLLLYSTYLGGSRSEERRV